MNHVVVGGQPPRQVSVFCGFGLWSVECTPRWIDTSGLLRRYTLGVTVDSCMARPVLSISIRGRGAGLIRIHEVYFLCFYCVGRSCVRREPHASRRCWCRPPCMRASVCPSICLSVCLYACFPRLGGVPWLFWYYYCSCDSYVSPAVLLVCTTTHLIYFFVCIVDHVRWSIVPKGGNACLQAEALLAVLHVLYVRACS